MDITTTVTVDEQEVWSSTFGASAESFSWWREVTFVQGDWDVPGVVRLGVEDPEDGSRTVTREVGVEDVVRAAVVASQTCVDACTARPIVVRPGEVDFDACVADCVMQIAVLGEVVYG